MRIGIDFDNTIICYDTVFCDLAKSWRLVPPDYQGTKRELRDRIRALPEGDLIWQRMQGQAYGKLIQGAQLFEGFKAFLAACQRRSTIEIFIVSHKTEFGHFDETKTSLPEAARGWLRAQGLLSPSLPLIPEDHVFFASTREEKIARIRALGCTHFIDDLVEVLSSPLFPTTVTRFLFSPGGDEGLETPLPRYSSWAEINHALFAS